MEKLSIPARVEIVKQVLLKGASGFQSAVALLGGVPVSATQDSALLSAYAHMPWLRAALGKVHDGVASAPWYIAGAWKENGSISKDGTKLKSPIKVKQWQNGRKLARERVVASLRASQTVEVREIFDHPMLDLLAEPNPFMSGYTLLGLVALHLDLVGEALWYVELEGNTPVRIWPIPPSWIKNRPDSTSGYFEITTTNDAIPDKVPLDFCVWFRLPDPSDPYESTVGTAGPLSDELEADEYAGKHVKSWFYNKARPDILISGTGLGRDEAERFEEKWLSKLKGWAKAHRPFVVGKEVQVTELSGKFKDMELVALRKWQRDIVFQAVGLPPEILGVLESSNRATIDTASYIFARWVIIPRLEVIRYGLQSQLAKYWGDEVVVEYLSPVEEDREFRLDVMKTAPWAWTIDQWRAVVGDNPFKDGQGDVIIIPNSSSIALASEITEWESPYTQEPKTEEEGDE